MSDLIYQQWFGLGMGPGTQGKPILCLYLPKETYGIHAHTTLIKAYTL